jgi:putative Ca2+/H+ antiporter (TMEM165/GDT1 family)
MDAVPLAAALQSVVERYAEYGPLLASFLANLLATFGDKGQLVVVTLASRYDAKKVFAGAMGAFSLWSLVEVLVGQWVVDVLPAGAITVVTGGMFLAFGVWTLWTASRKFRSGDGDDVALTGGGLEVGISGRILPDEVLARVGTHGGVLTSFVFILFAEFGDKTQALTINLAATFPHAPVAVFVGVVAALGLRTGVDAIIGEQFERRVPTKWIELVAGVVFVAFAALVFGLP